MINIKVLKYTLFTMVTLAASYEDIEKHKVYTPLLLSLIPIALIFASNQLSGYIILTITISVLCVSRFLKIQKGDILAYFASSFFLTEHQIVPFFALNIVLALATLALTKYFQKQEKFALIPSILFSCLIITLTGDIMNYHEHQSKSHYHA